MKFEWTNQAGEVDGNIVYTLYPADGDRPLYIGMTQELINRLAGHRNQKPRKPWYSDISRVVITHCESREAAAAHERHLIQTLDPIHNFVRYETVGA
ncbi:GIY-YIG nuclease family protein [Mycobacterium sp. DL440]|uniref:GIY-YIG nuclease family protein n=1 Tax=Mycobacterium sp. DL440 TaxID=2675523 RepID=UPI00141F1553|nr:GIY-YIG nuclease family protein [Mycobacterium sp. DL440]